MNDIIHTVEYFAFVLLGTVGIGLLAVSFYL